MPGIGVGIGIGLAGSGAAAGGGAPPVVTEFIFTVKTDNAGPTSNDQFQLPLLSGETYNFDIDWGDGDTATITSSAPQTHTYPSAGTYEIKIGGVNNTFPTMQFNNTNDVLKMLHITNWGNVEWDSLAFSFYGCINLEITATDEPNFSSVTTAEQGFRDAPITNFPNVDFSSCLSFNQTWRDCSSLLTCGSFITTALDDALGAFFACTVLDVDISGWSIANLTEAGSLMSGTAFSQTNYDLMLVAWEGQTHNNSVAFHAGGATYSAGAPATARAALVSDLWSFTDGGPA